ncbi:MAG: cell division protein FtsN [Glomeribacter sp. 1016415]|uniref:Cell division protein FtsN n=1 Tax=Mycoavidus cysteinexigens TaxID=1553431 RepID=A0A2Z6EY48_9BURK|nr:cell division protein FtsN [Glomeribacter sp. 1016415]BBE10371.1 Cell division protein FtsN [Mycoavidus cysteinexigens]GAM53256.1 cell division protein FtsN [bacterium endosymbiont of Mortierella elongata FMR23-6]GLR00788.1 cell division protein [Mycoavidus cysteinexigens]
MMKKQRRASKQSGGTLLGLVLGLTIGLAIAVVVALYVTRAPTPFVAKNGTPPNAENLSNPTQADPNRLLQGNSSGQPAAPAGQFSEGPMSPRNPTGDPQIVEVPLSSTAPNRQTANKPEVAPNGANGSYALQVGAYKTKADAEQQRAKLALQGFESKITRYEGAGILYYRVRLGPFPQFEQMNRVRQRLAEAGIDTAIIRPSNNP